MFENISKKQEKVQEKVQKQQERNDKDCRELTDEELEQVVGGAPRAQMAGHIAQFVPGAVVTQLVTVVKGAPAAVTLDK